MLCENCFVFNCDNAPPLQAAIAFISLLPLTTRSFSTEPLTVHQYPFLIRETVVVRTLGRPAQTFYDLLVDKDTINQPARNFRLRVNAFAAQTHSHCLWLTLTRFPRSWRSRVLPTLSPGTGKTAFSRKSRDAAPKVQLNTSPSSSSSGDLYTEKQIAKQVTQQSSPFTQWPNCWFFRSGPNSPGHASLPLHRKQGNMSSRDSTADVVESKRPKSKSGTGS